MPCIVTQVFSEQCDKRRDRYISNLIQLIRMRKTWKYFTNEKINQTLLK